MSVALCQKSDFQLKYDIGFEWVLDGSWRHAGCMKRWAWSIARSLQSMSSNALTAIWFMSSFLFWKLPNCRESAIKTTSTTTPPTTATVATATTIITTSLHSRGSLAVFKKMLMNQIVVRALELILCRLRAMRQGYFSCTWQPPGPIQDIFTADFILKLEEK